MIAVASDHVGHVTVNPLFKEIEGAVIARSAHVPAFHPLALGKLPFVGSLVEHQHPQLVAKIIDHGSLRVMAHADGIGTHLLELTDFTPPHFTGNNGSQHSGIMMQADALHLHPFAVEGKSVVGVELQRAESHLHFILVEQSALL